MRHCSTDTGVFRVGLSVCQKSSWEKDEGRSCSHVPHELKVEMLLCGMLPRNMPEKIDPCKMEAAGCLIQTGVVDKK